MDGIELQAIRKTYSVENRTHTVLDGINLHIPEKKITVILGRSGCGKTTLLRLIGGLEAPDSGNILFHAAHKTAYVFQESRLMPWLTVWENVKFGLKKQRIDTHKLQSLIDTVGLHDFAQAYPHQLSGGMQQRVAIARALAYEPSFIMMDEPFAALDYFTRRQMQSELIRLQEERGASILFVTHNIDEALLLGHKILVIEGGKIKQELAIASHRTQRDLLSPPFISYKRSILHALGI